MSHSPSHIQRMLLVARVGDQCMSSQCGKASRKRGLVGIGDSPNSHEAHLDTVAGRLEVTAIDMI